MSGQLTSSKEDETSSLSLQNRWVKVIGESGLIEEYVHLWERESEMLSQSG